MILVVFVQVNAVHLISISKEIFALHILQIKQLARSINAYNKTLEANV